MSHYKVRRTRPDWFNEDFTEDDERSGALVEDLNRKLTERKKFTDISVRLACCHLLCFPAFSPAGYIHAEHEATDIALEALKPGYGVWLRIDSDRNPLAALAGFGRAACRHPWYVHKTFSAVV